MAVKTDVRLIDDLAAHRGEGEVEAAGTFVFGKDGKEYEIELSEANAQALADALAPFVAAGRPVKRATASTGSVSRKRTGGKRDTKASKVREWARERGIDVPARGRIKPELEAQYDAEHPGGAQDENTAAPAAQEAPSEAPPAPAVTPAWG